MAAFYTSAPFHIRHSEWLKCRVSGNTSDGGIDPPPYSSSISSLTVIYSFYVGKQSDANPTTLLGRERERAKAMSFVQLVFHLFLEWPQHFFKIRYLAPEAQDGRSALT